MNSNLTAPSFLHNLRENTSELHTALESLPISRQIISHEVSVNDYTLYLSLMYDVIKDAETNIFTVLTGIVSDLNSRYKHTILLEDLNTLQSDKNITANNNPLSKNLIDKSAAFALGIMYVTEGSTLGGRVILKNIQVTLGYDENNGARYFAGYGSSTGSSWKKFLEFMTNYENECNCGAKIIAGANYAFNAIAQHLKENSSK